MEFAIQGVRKKSTFFVFLVRFIQLRYFYAYGSITYIYNFLQRSRCKVDSEELSFYLA